MVSKREQWSEKGDKDLKRGTKVSKSDLKDGLGRVYVGQRWEKLGQSHGRVEGSGARVRAECQNLGWECFWGCYPIRVRGLTCYFYMVHAFQCIRCMLFTIILIEGHILLFKLMAA